MKTNTPQTELSLIKTNLNKIFELENEIRNTQKEFKKNNTPLYKVGETFIIHRIDNGVLFEIVKINTTTFDREMSAQTSSSLNYLSMAEEAYTINPKFEEKRINMELAENGLMFMYILKECGKNGKAKKIGARSHILTEYEITQYLTEQLIIKVS